MRCATVAPSTGRPCGQQIGPKGVCAAGHAANVRAAVAPVPQMAATAAADPFATSPSPAPAGEPVDANGDPIIPKEDWARDCDEHGEIKAMCPRCYPHLAARPSPRFEAAAGPGRGGGLRSSFSGPDPNSKQALANAVADIFGDGRSYEVSTGSTVPRELFHDVYGRFGMACPASEDKPLLARGIVELAEGAWDDSCDSGMSHSGGGSTVTREGMRRFVDAVRHLNDLFGDDL